MQVEHTGTMENVELQARLNVGGRWYGRATVVSVDAADAAILKSRGFAVEAKNGAKPANVELKLPESVPAQQVPVQTKAEAPVETPAEQLPVKDVPAETPSVPLKKEESGNHGKRTQNRR